MHSARVAEWLLSLVVSPERARSTVGDWMEGATERGDTWFWSCVFRTVLAHIWSDLSESPVEMIRIGFDGYFYSLLLVAASLILMIPVLISGAILAQFLPSPPHAWQVPEIIGTLGGLAGLCVCEFQTGRWIARRAPGREMAACIASCLAPRLLFGLLTLVIMHFWSSDINQFMANHPGEPGPATVFINSFPFEIFLFAGALQVRRKSSQNVAT